MVARTEWPPSICTRNIVLGSASVISPSTSIFSSLFAKSPFFFAHENTAGSPAPNRLWEQTGLGRRLRAGQDPRRPVLDRDRVLEVRRHRAVGRRDRPVVV